MNIAVNTRLLIKDRLEGIGWFTFETLKRISQNHPEHNFIFIFDRPYDEDFIFADNVTPVIAWPQSRHPFLWYLFFEFGIPSILRKHKADIFISPDNFLSLKVKLKSVLVMHDINYIHNPKYNTWLVNKFYQHFVPKYVKKATRVATVSEFTKSDIMNAFEVAENKIDVVYNGANKDLIPIDNETQKEIRDKYTNGSPYFLFIGLILPRKNVDNLIRAFDEFKQETSNNVKLLIVGSRKYMNRDIRDVYEKANFKQDIIFTGRLISNDFKKVIASATALVYASRFEGFGIPILEAMYCDVPVITSKVSSMPEVGGDAALYVDPDVVSSIKDAMLKVFCDTTIRNILIEKARIQRKKFTWDKTADLLWKSIEKTIEETSSVN